MKEECGVTEISLDNAKELLAQHGEVDHIYLTADTKKGDYFVQCYWVDGHQHTFSGFSWGYGGTGCVGLDRFLVMLGVPTLTSSMIPIDKFGKTACSYFVRGAVRSL